MTAITCVKCGALIREEPPFEDKLACYSTCWDCARKAKSERDRRKDKKRKGEEKWDVNHARSHRSGWVFWTGRQTED